MPRRPIPIGGHGNYFFTRVEGGWMARTRFRDNDGVLRTVSATARSKTAAQQALDQDLLDRRQHGYSGSQPDGITPDTLIADLCEEWLREAKLRNLSTSTLRIYRSSVELYIKEYMGAWRVRDATVGRVDRVIKEHIARGLDHSALRKHLHQVFDVAVRHDALPSNPVPSIARVKKRKKKVRALTDTSQVAEINALIDKWERAENPGPRPTRDMRDLILLLVATGARIGEVLALRWSDINLLAERPYLMITGTIKQEKGLGVYRQPKPKTDTSIRPLELPPSVAAMLLERRVQQGSNPIDAVFPSRVGTWIPYSTVRRRWKAITEGTAYEWVTFKTYRASLATLVARQLGIEVAQEQLGHASKATTEQFYKARNEDAPRVSAVVESFIGQAFGSVAEDGDSAS